MKSGKRDLVVDKDFIKFVAVLSMIVDHFAIIYSRVEGFTGLHVFARCLGRLSFPLFAFCLVDGFIRTSSRKKYLIRLGILALVSEIPYNLFSSGKLIDWSNKNVIFTYVIGFLLLYALDMLNEITVLKFFGIIFPFMLAADLIGTDYGSLGILLISCMYFKPITEKANWWGYIVLVGLFVLFSGSMYVFLLPAFWMLKQYNGLAWFRFNGKIEKILNYSFYPVHLVLFWLLGFVLGV